MKTEFWNANLNPITMYSKCVLVRDENRIRHRHSKENYLKDGNLKGYLLANELMKELCVGAVKLKRLFESIGIEPKYNRGITYYPEKSVQQIKDILAEPKKIPVIDKTGYISNQELMTMFNFTTDKAFNIVLKEKIAKKRFGGNVNYYEKDNAISIFMKYKKN